MTQTISEAELSVPSLESPPKPAPSVPEQSSYGQILKSSALVGGSSAMNTVIGIVRTKALAVLLGPAGFGLFGLYGSIASLTQSVAGIGINSSGVRQIAAAVASDDGERIAQTTVVLRRTSVFLGMLGAGLLAMFSRQVSRLTFGTEQHTGAVCLLSIAVLFQLISGGQGALIQGMRRIADLAKMSVLGALFGTLISVPMVYFLRENGVVPSLIAIAATTIVTSWWYSRKVQVQIRPMTASHVGREAAALLKLGFAFMASGLVGMGVAYAVRVIVLRKIGFEAAGFYQSAWALGGLYVGVILQAMAADFYPRLTAMVHDHRACNRLVNEQARMGLLLAGPGVLATLTFAPAVIALLYSAKFGAAVGILTLGLPWSGAAGDYLADGLHYYGKGPGGSLGFLRTGLGCCESRPGVDLCGIFWFERRRHRILWVVCLPRYSDISDRAPAQRFSLVVRESTDGPALRFLDRGGFLWVLCTARTLGDHGRDVGSSSK